MFSINVQTIFFSKGLIDNLSNFFGICDYKIIGFLPPFPFVSCQFNAHMFRLLVQLWGHVLEGLVMNDVHLSSLADNTALPLPSKKKN